MCVQTYMDQMCSLKVSDTRCTHVLCTGQRLGSCPHLQFLCVGFPLHVLTLAGHSLQHLTLLGPAFVEAVRGGGGGSEGLRVPRVSGL